MKYFEYIKLGFNRIDYDDKVIYERTGHFDFDLRKELNEKMYIAVNSESLNEPKLYIKMNNEDRYHILQITTKCVKDLCL